jgi:galactokinase
MTKSFEDVFGSAPGVRTDAPGRVNLLGEHTDYNAGLVLPTAIPQKTRVCAALNGLGKFRVYSANLDEQCEFTLEEAPKPHFATYVYGCIREFASLSPGVLPVDLHIQSDVPIGAGLSSSAALEVATLRALRELFRVQLDDVRIAQLAQRAEIHYAGVNVGIMDQMASSLATGARMLFLDTRTLEHELLPLPDRAEIMVVNSGVSRSLANSDYNLRRSECTTAASILGVRALRDARLESISTLPAPFRQRARHVITENARVAEAATRIGATRFGQLMNDSHTSLRDDYEVSVPALDLLVSLLQSEGSVHGAKLTGAGFGGACVALCRQGTTQAVAQAVLDRYRKESGMTATVLVPVGA